MHGESGNVSRVLFFPVDFAIPFGRGKRDMRQALLHTYLVLTERISVGYINVEPLTYRLHLRLWDFEIQRYQVWVV